jgi:hypothetical protein
VGAVPGATFQQVWAKVYALGASPPAAPPTDGTAVQGTVIGASSWQFVVRSQEIPVVPAACPQAQPTAPDALFAVWCVFSTGTGLVPVLKTRDFAGMASTMTDCTGSGSGSASASGSGVGDSLAEGQAGAQAAVETAPRQVRVSAKGFSGPAAALNARWVLTLRADGGCLWDNGGDGVAGPRIELRCDGVVATEWRLTLAHAGRRVSYTCPAAGWRALAANELRAANPGAWAPETLVVTPV